MALNDRIKNRQKAVNNFKKEISKIKEKYVKSYEKDINYLKDVYDFEIVIARNSGHIVHAKLMQNDAHSKAEEIKNDYKKLIILDLGNAKSNIYSSFADKNISDLEVECKKPKFSRLENQIMVLAGSLNELNINSDLYESDLSELANKKKEYIVSTYNNKEISSALNNLIIGNFLDDSDLELVGNFVFSKETVLPKSSLLSSFGINRRTAELVGGIVSEDKVLERYGKISELLGADLTNLVVNENPDLFLYTKPAFSEYISKLEDAYLMLDSNIESEVRKDPSRFAYLTKFGNYDSKNIEAKIESDDSNKGIYDSLSIEGYDPEIVQGVIEGGFRPFTRGFIGGRIISYESLHKNAYSFLKDKDKNDIEATIFRLVREGFINRVGNRSGKSKTGYSLNLDKSNIQSSVLRSYCDYLNGKMYSEKESIS